MASLHNRWRHNFGINRMTNQPSVAATLRAKTVFLTGPLNTAALVSFMFFSDRSRSDCRGRTAPMAPNQPNFPTPVHAISASLRASRQILRRAPAQHQPHAQRAARVANGQTHASGWRA